MKLSDPQFCYSTAEDSIRSNRWVCLSKFPARRLMLVDCSISVPLLPPSWFFLGSLSTANRCPNTKMAIFFYQNPNTMVKYTEIIIDFQSELVFSVSKSFKITSYAVSFIIQIGQWKNAL